ncbi:MAG: hypothetical protein QM621_15010 [Aeromicrobium sp.]|uniref:hypothetical protein n=1 Tax=Aeromicrobium sp. TaxID=1871063 RepID=UPI0039E49328
MGMLTGRHRGRNEDAGPDLSKATKARLVEYAAEHGIEVDPKAKRADLFEEITAALNAAAASPAVVERQGA